MPDRLRALYARLPRETVRYVIAGVCSTLVDLGVFSLLRALGMDDKAANALSIAAAIVFAYLINKLYVFRRHAATRAALAAEFSKFVAGRLATAALEYFGYPVLLRVIGGERELIAKALTIVVVFVLNYLISKLLVFTAGGVDEGK